MTKISLYPTITTPVRSTDLTDVSEDIGGGNFTTKRIALNVLAPELSKVAGSFDNTISGLTATTIKGAIDEIDGDLDALTTATGLLPTVNLYTGNGTLTADRTISMGANKLILTPTTIAASLLINTISNLGTAILNVVGFSTNDFGAYFRRNTAIFGAIGVDGQGGTGIYVSTAKPNAAINVVSGHVLIPDGSINMNSNPTFARIAVNVDDGNGAATSFTNIYAVNGCTASGVVADLTHQGAGASGIVLRANAGVSMTNPIAIVSVEGNVYLNTGVTTAKARTLIGGVQTDAITARLKVKGYGATSATNSFEVINSASTALFTVKDNGVLNAANLPTSAAGLVAGDIWSNSGVLNVV